MKHVKTLETIATKKLPKIKWFRGDWIAGRGNPKHDVYRAAGMTKNREVYGGDWEDKEDHIIITVIDEDVTIGQFEINHAGCVAM